MLADELHSLASRRGPVFEEKNHVAGKYTEKVGIPDSRRCLRGKGSRCDKHVPVRVSRHWQHPNFTRRSSYSRPWIRSRFTSTTLHEDAGNSGSVRRDDWTQSYAVCDGSVVSCGCGTQRVVDDDGTRPVISIRKTMWNGKERDVRRRGISQHSLRSVTQKY